MIVDVGFVVSVDAVAADRFDCRVAGCAPRSANRLTVACCMLRSSGTLPPLSASRPQAHCTVPELNTRAPLGALYIVMLCVAVPFCLIAAAVVGEHLEAAGGRRGELDLAGGAEAVVGVDVPLVARACWARAAASGRT